MPALTALGTLVKVGDIAGPGAVFTTISGLRDITVGGITLNVIDVSTHNNTSGIEEILASGLKRLAELTFTVNYDPDDATHDELTGLWSLSLSSEKRAWQVVLPNEVKTIEFDGFVVGLAPNAPVDAELSMDVTVKPTDRYEMTSPTT